MDNLLHKQVGVEQKLFNFSDVSPGCPFFLPDGFYIYEKLLQYLRKEYKLRNYQEIMTPDICKNKLWMRSGHYDNYRENMFPVFTHWPNGSLVSNVDDDFRWTIPKECFQNEKGEWNAHEMDENYACKSMNCPLHCVMFNMFPKSHLDLPLRLAEFGTLHRNENVGSLRGLFRVRKFRQDDAHIFCARSQIQSEIKNFLEFLDKTYKLFDFEYYLELSTRPEEKYIGDLEVWNEAEDILKQELEASGKEWKLNKGDGAFYGPKIDVHLKDSIGRYHQCGTVQLDFNLPEKFDLKYLDENGENHRPVIVHRAVFGSLERFIGILVEHYTQTLTASNRRLKLPFWLSKQQFIICTLFKPKTDQESLSKYAETLREKLLSSNWRMNVDIDTSTTHIKQKIKNAVKNNYHFAIVVGPKEVENQTVAINNLNNNAPIAYNMNFEDIIKIYDEHTLVLA